MYNGFRSAALIVIALDLLVAGLSPSVIAQAGGNAGVGQTGAGASWKPPRTAEGQPDIQGVWDFATITPLERPKNFAGREFLTEQEIADLERRARLAETNEARSSDRKADLQLAYNAFWWARGTHVVATKRTSLIIDPKDGQIPPLVPSAQAREAARAATRQHPAGPEDFDLNDRCIVGFNAGPPMIPNAYNNNVQIFQSRDNVVILNEMVHNARIIPFGGRPHLGAAIQQWVGDSRGRWDGNTLVIDTTNFSGEGLGLMFSGFRGSADENLHLTERFRLLDANLLLYEFTIDDPTTYSRPWTGSLTMTKSHDKLYEYACHEGNYSMANTLSAERAQEQVPSRAVTRSSADK